MRSFALWQDMVTFLTRGNVLCEVELHISTRGEQPTDLPCMNPLEIVTHVYIHRF